MRFAGRTLLTVVILLAVAMSLWTLVWLQPFGLNRSAGSTGGWYLFIPPQEYNEQAAFLYRFEILDDAPPSQWKQQGAYDSASECEANKQKLLMTANRRSTESMKKIRNKDRAPVSTFLEEKDLADAIALDASRCVRSDDPRLRR